MDPRRRLPAIHSLVALQPDLPRPLVLDAARALVAEVRAGAAPPEDWAAALRLRVDHARRPKLRRVINATGVVLHTNLGRAPLSRAAVDALAQLGGGYANLEMLLDSGARGGRLQGVVEPLRSLTGAEAAVVVNNNAAAVLLMLTAHAAGREVVVSRGELVEIGGSFRVPDVITAGGARLREVGTTNRTRVADVARAIGPDTAAILKVHPSNFRVTGFTEAPAREELAALARERGVLYLEDLGSGALAEGLGEPTVAEVVAAGADLVCFSGDKLLGGPQAGLCVGRSPLVGAMREHPLYRALRLDRLVLLALEATLRGYLAGELPPAVGMLRATPAELGRRARRWAEVLGERGLPVKVVPDVSAAGGGALPGEGLPTMALSLAVPDVDAFAAALRTGEPPVVARVKEGELRVDPRTVLPSEEEALLGALARTWADRGGR